MIVRELLKSDIDKIVNLEKEFDDGWNFNQLSSAFDGGRFYSLGAFDGQNLIAFVSFSVAIDTSDIEMVLVSSAYRRKGIAKTLIENAQNKLINLGVKKVFLEVRESNVPAKALYGGLGYKEISVRKNYYPDGENATIMAKELL